MSHSVDFRRKVLGIREKENPASSQGRRRDTARLPGHDSLL
ncbi:hypothetical protein SK355_03650 [Candidatus Fukatsuia symbiotica]|nr:hypothetical protein [Candidatus Fukatsuia symbiotica]MEA9444416.1 hypothetical protein [Candidatus Fukatsuia symbiotica]